MPRLESEDHEHIVHVRQLEEYLAKYPYHEPVGMYAVGVTRHFRLVRKQGENKNKEKR